MSVEQLLEAVKDAKAHNNGTNQTRYWYFRFVEYFFENPKIIAMEQEPGGFEYLVILLKLYCKSLSTGGTLRVRANNMADLNVIAKMVRHDIVIVERAIEYFIKNGIIDVVGETDNYNDRYLNMDMPYVKNMTGRSSAAADQKRLKRQSNKETEEIEVHEKEKLPKPQKNRKAYGCFENVLLSDEEFKELDTEYENAKVVINRLSIYKKQYNKTYANDYAAVLKFATTDGKKRVNDEEEKRKKLERKIKQWENEALIGATPPDEARELLGEEEYKRLVKIAEENY